MTSSDNTLLAALALDATLATVSVVGLCVHADAGAVGGSESGTRQLTCSVGADFTGLTGCVAFAAVVAAHLGIVARATAQDLTRGASTLAAITKGSALTDGATSTTVVGVCVGVDAASGTNGGGSAGAGRCTLASGADFTRFASRATSATVGSIGLQIDTLSGAVGQSCLTGQLTLACVASFP